MNAPGGTNLVFGLQAQDINLGSMLDAEAQRIARFGQQAAAAFNQFSQQSTRATETARAAGTAAEDAGGKFAKFWERAAATATGMVVHQAINAVISDVTALAKSVIELPAAYEQSEIGFTAMLNNNGKAADTMLAKLQALANLTPFKFGEEQQAARTLLGLGQDAEKVLPELVDIDTAVAAIGGGEPQIQRVTAALGKMSAEGRVSAIFMNELTRDGIPAWVMLSEYMGVPIEKLREMSKNGEITASTFEKAFHTYTVTHWGEALTTQSQTFNGLISTAQDLFEQFTRTFGMPIIQELEPKLRGAVSALQDPKVLAWLEQAGQKAATFTGWIFEAVGGVAQLLGLPTPDLSKNLQSASDAVKQFAGDWSQTQAPVDKTKDQIAGIRDDLAKMRDDEAEMALGYEHQIAPLQERVTLLDRAYERENAMANLAVTQEKLARDRILAQNIYTQQGRDAAARLPEEEARLAEQQRGIKHTSDKEALQDQITALQAQEKAEKESYDRREREAEARIRALEKIGAAPAPPPGAKTGPSVPVAGDDMADRYAQSVTAAAQHAPTLLDRLFGTKEQQQKAGSDLADALFYGFTDKNNPQRWEQWLNDSFGTSGAAGIAAGWGSALGKQVREAIGTQLGIDLPGPGGTGKGPESNDSRFADAQATGDQFTANPFDPDSWNPFSSHNPLWRALSAPFTQAQATTARQRSKPDHYPTGHDPGGSWSAGKSYQDGTTDWTWQDGHSVGYNGPYGGGRALGGPVAAHGVYTVGEAGPETLRMGSMGGYITPGGAGGDLGTITLRIVDANNREIMREYVRMDRDYINKQIAISMRGA